MPKMHKRETVPPTRTGQLERSFSVALIRCLVEYFAAQQNIPRLEAAADILERFDTDEDTTAEQRGWLTERMTEALSPDPTLDRRFEE